MKEMAIHRVATRAQCGATAVVLLVISSTEHRINELVRHQVAALAGPQELILATCEEEEAGVVWPHHPPWHPIEDFPAGET